MMFPKWFAPIPPTRGGAGSGARRAPGNRTCARLGALVLAAVIAVGVSDRSAAQRFSRSNDLSQRTYYEVTRVDERLCPSPFCGGVFVKRLNNAWQACPDGSLAEECYAGRIDWSALGLSPDDVAALEADFVQHRAVVRGRLEQVDSGFAVPVPVLVVSNAWRGVTGAPPEDKGRYFGVVPSGIVCITTPCPSLTELRLNSRRSHPLHELDLTPSGANDVDIGLGLEALYEGSGLIVLGTHGSIEGPAGLGRVLRADAFYVEIPGAGGPVCGVRRCAVDQVCCNPVRGICTPPLLACIQ